MNHKKKNPGDYLALERRHRAQIVAGLRTAGLSYNEIREQLGISLRQVETVLGEAAGLRAQRFSVAEIAAQLGVPSGSMNRILPGPRTGAVTDRQAEVMAGLAHQNGMQVDVLAEFLNVWESTAYAISKRLAESGQVRIAKVQRGRAWVFPATRDIAARYLGYRPGEWEPSLMFAKHYRAVAQARVMLAGSDPEMWVSERVLWHRAGKKLAAEAAAAHRGKPVLEFSTTRRPLSGRPHIHDGWFHGVFEGHFGWWAIEVELTVKDRASLDIALQGAIRAARDAEPVPMIGLLYLCRGREVDAAVTAASERLPAELDQLDLLLVIRDFDTLWNRFAESRRAMRESTAAAKRQRRNLIQLAKEAS